ncbi:NAD(P)H-hydrate dehydratase [Streptomyces sp. 3MP-14]|uniref:Bifunctional NAD(P)H-hydrate repair enzyme n=1 Tax=Streptomyces mimosae TaxID=2586635 RepID=A0A5N6AI44_9ACTN|nr:MULTISPECIES: NAD(P)H-hydrate dehydratase [Streptomyces]KAB8167228.1 NAD(P)H-hydrate dehydratase [Streptomyces mimosae]KAB8177169.1 NAD(P)H-hydrate dehydratase [Streptomyces sp. 3MP-14]
MRTAYRVETVRAAESALMARLPEGTLMNRAAAGLAAACAELLRPGLGRRTVARVVLLVGGGDNGGDALFAGARLARRGIGVNALLLAPDRAHPAGLAALRAAGGRGLAVADIAPGALTTLLGRASMVVDGITGIGGRGGLRPVAAELAERVTASGAPVIAVDLPSGVDADTGEVRGPVLPATLTVTFGTLKPGLLVDPARQHAGDVRLVDIGLRPLLPVEPDVAALTPAEVAALLPRPTGESDKYRRGVLGVAAGSARYPGAAVLTVGGALRGGVGAVRYAGPAHAAVIARHPETLVSPGTPAEAGRVQAWVAGPGLGDHPEAERVVNEVLAADVPLLLDADALRGLDPARVRARSAPTLLTPHAGEAAALLGVARERVESSRLTSVRELAERFGATVLLKGSTTLVADPAGPVLVNETGTPWLATAGSGDVLSGLAGGLLAAGLAARDAGAVAAHLHGLAGHAAPMPATASGVTDALPTAWQSLTG